MKLLVNVTPLAPPLTGIGHYTRQLLLQLVTNPEFSAQLQDIKGFDMFREYSKEELLSLLHGNDLSASTGDTVSVGQNNSDQAGVENKEGEDKQNLKRGLSYRLQTCLQHLKPYIKRVPGARRLKRLILNRSASTALDRNKDYIYWEPNYVMHPFKGLSVATIYDLSHIHYPEYHPKQRVDDLTQGLAVTLAQANRLISISEFSREQIINELSPSQEIDLVQPCVEAAFFNVTEQEGRALRDKYPLPENYLLSVATLEPRKNFIGLLQAYALLPDDHRQAYPLILAGSKGWLTEELESILQPMEDRGEVRYLGYVDQDDMPALYHNASVMAYVSFYEGFGMPIAEAMAAGTAVVASNCTSMPEVAGEFAELVDPHDIESIRDGLDKLLSNPQLRLSRSKEGKEWAQQWNWRHSALSLMNSFKQLR